MQIFKFQKQKRRKQATSDSVSVRVAKQLQSPLLTGTSVECCLLPASRVRKSAETYHPILSFFFEANEDIVHGAYSVAAA